MTAGMISSPKVALTYGKTRIWDPSYTVAEAQKSCLFRAPPRRCGAWWQLWIV